MSLEFSRNVTFGQYIDIRSAVHSLDARTKMICAGVIMACAFMTRGLISIAPLFALAIIVQLTTRIPIGYTLRGYRLLFRTMLFFVPFQILFYQALPSVEMHYYWRWWILSVSYEGILGGIFTLSRVIVLYHSINTLMFTTTMMDLSDGAEIMMDPLKRLKFPVNEFVMTMTIALKFVPLLITELERLMRAQIARGVRFDQGSVIARTRKLVPVLIPLFVKPYHAGQWQGRSCRADCIAVWDYRSLYWPNNGNLTNDRRNHTRISSPRQCRHDYLPHQPRANSKRLLARGAWCQRNRRRYAHLRLTGRMGLTTAPLGSRPWSPQHRRRVTRHCRYWTVAFV
ncbi:MAG: energy-coupling factor transporter transmembrane component T [Chloroflexales bacterium]|nr:energy-coupling factor transporter transmembrane component T [Chloroflexales bacterium]